MSLIDLLRPVRHLRPWVAEMKKFFLTMGRYDAVVIIEAPDAETVAKLALAIGSQGNVQTETLRAFSQDEFLDIVSGLP